MVELEWNMTVCLDNMASGGGVTSGGIVTSHIPMSNWYQNYLKSIPCNEYNLIIDNLSVNIVGHVAVVLLYEYTCLTMTHVTVY